MLDNSFIWGIESKSTNKRLMVDPKDIFGKRIYGYGNEDFRVIEIDKNIANDIIIKSHYSHKIYSLTYIHLGVYINNNLVGVLQFGYAMNPASGSSVVTGTENDQYLELNRMWLDDIASRNSESMAISYAIKFIKNRYKRIKWIQSFADERCGGFGIVYQAANFDYYGEHSSIFWELDGIVYHNSLMTRDPKLSKSAAHIQLNKDRAVSSEYRQFRYIYWIDRSWKPRATRPQLPFIKHYDKEVNGS